VLIGNTEGRCQRALLDVPFVAQTDEDHVSGEDIRRCEAADQESGDEDFDRLNSMNDTCEASEPGSSVCFVVGFG
jgi:hypothetical protein